MLGEHGIPRDSGAGRKELGRRMEQRRQSEEEVELKAMKRGWYLGDRAFRKELLGQMEERVKEHHFGEDRAEAEQEWAERKVSAGLQRLGWKEGDLERRRKGDPGKVKLAMWLRAETTMTLKWIAQRLRMGTWTHLNHLLYWQRQRG